MTPPLQVRISADAQAQIVDQVDFIDRRSPGNAIKWQLRLGAAIVSIGRLPTHLPDPVASQRMRRPICKYVFERTYLVFYEVDVAAGTVDVLNFRHGARLPRRYEP